MDERVAANSDELLRMIEQDELEDRAEATTRMSIGDYAKLRHVTPQLVHYYIRNKGLKKHKCDCGRYVVDIEEADVVMKFKKEEAVNGLGERQTGEGPD